MREPILLVMAAGMGSRYGGLKQIDRITDNGEIILDFSLYDAYKAGFKKAVFVIREENLQDFKEILDNGAGRFIDIEYAFQKIDDLPDGFGKVVGREKPWGTGHAIMTARKIVNQPFAVINADDFYGANSFKAMYEFLSNTREKGEFAMMAYELENTITENGSVSRGVCTLDEDEFLVDIVERTKIMGIGENIAYTEDDETWNILDSKTPVSMNFWGYTPEIMIELEDRFTVFLEEIIDKNPLKAEYLIPKVTDELIKEGKATCKALKTSDVWHGVTYREDKKIVKKAMENLKNEGKYPENLWNFK